MNPNCIKNVQLAAGRTLTKGELDGIESRMKLARRDIARNRPEDFMTMTPEQLTMEASKLAKERMIEDVVKNHENQIRNAAVRAKMDQYLSQFKAGPNGKLLAAIQRVFYMAGSKTGEVSVEMNYASIRNDINRYLQVVKKADSGRFFGLMEDVSKRDAIIKELNGEASGDKDAAFVAQTFQSINEFLAKRADRAGIGFHEDENWRSPQPTEWTKVASNPTEWLEDHMGWVDRNAYLNPDGSRMSNDELRRFLTEVHETQATNGANKRMDRTSGGGMSTLAGNRNKPRQIHYKDAASYTKAMEKYGRTTNIHSLFNSHFDRLARDIAIAETLGNTHKENFEYMIDKAFTEDSAAAKTDAEREQLEALTKKAKAAYGLFTNGAGIQNQAWARALAAVRHVMQSSMLGFGPLSSLPDAGIVALSAKLNGLPEMQAFAQAFKGMASKEDREMLARLGFGIDSMQSAAERAAAEDLVTDVPALLSDAVQRLSGQERFDTGIRSAIALPLLDLIGKLTRDTDLASVKAGDHSFFAEHNGVTDMIWSAWRAADVETGPNGDRTLLSPEAIYAIPDEKLDPIIEAHLAKSSEEYQAAVQKVEADAQVIKDRIDADYQTAVTAAESSDAGIRYKDALAKADNDFAKAKKDLEASTDKAREKIESDYADAVAKAKTIDKSADRKAAIEKARNEFKEKRQKINESADAELASLRDQREAALAKAKEGSNAPERKAKLEKAKADFDKEGASLDKTTEANRKKIDSTLRKETAAANKLNNAAERTAALKAAKEKHAEEQSKEIERHKAARAEAKTRYEALVEDAKAVNNKDDIRAAIDEVNQKFDAKEVEARNNRQKGLDDVLRDFKSQLETAQKIDSTAERNAALDKAKADMGAAKSALNDQMSTAKEQIKAERDAKVEAAKASPDAMEYEAALDKAKQEKAARTEDAKRAKSEAMKETARFRTVGDGLREQIDKLNAQTEREKGWLESAWGKLNDARDRANRLLREFADRGFFRLQDAQSGADARGGLLINLSEKAELDAQIARLAAETKNGKQITNFFDAIKRGAESFGNRRSELGQKLGARRRELEDRIHQAELRNANTQKRFDAAEAQATTKLGKVESEVNAYLKRVKKSVDEKIAQIQRGNTKPENVAKLQDTIDNLSNRIEKKQESFDKWKGDLQKRRAEAKARNDENTAAELEKISELEQKLELAENEHDIAAYLATEKNRDALESFADNISWRNRQLSERSFDAGERLGYRRAELEARIKEMQDRVDRSAKAHEERVGKRATDLDKRFTEAVAALRERAKDYADSAARRAEYAAEFEKRLGKVMEDERARLRSDAATKLLATVTSELQVGARGSMRGSIWEKVSMGLNAPRGTFLGEMARFFWMFKNTPLGIAYAHMIERPKGLPDRQSPWVYRAKFAAYSTILGAIGLQMKALAIGEDPQEVATGTFLLKSILAGGSMGIFGDVLFQGGAHTTNGFAGLFGGPGLSAIEDIYSLYKRGVDEVTQGKDANITSKLLEFTRKYATPGMNIWYLRAVFNHMVYQQLQDTLDPGWSDRLAKRQQERGVNHYWRPGEMTPERAPDFSKVAP